MTLAAWLHTLSPFVWRISGDFGIRWYGLAYLAGFAVAYYLLVWLAKRRLILIPPQSVSSALITFVLGVLIGGRLGYVLVYDQAALVTFTKSFPFWGVLAIHHGGMASHGGIVGVIVAGWRISRGFKDPSTGLVVGRCAPLHVMDVSAMICPAGLFFGRLANFVNGELLGRIVSPPGKPGPWWTVQYPQELKGITDVSPTGVVTGVKPAQPLSAEQGRELYELLQGVGAPTDSLGRKINFVIEHSREFGPQLRNLLASRHASQLYQACAEGIILGVALWLMWYKPRKPGFIGGWFLIIYGVLRILTEYWRLPDPQFAEERPWGLSRGQWLSAAMIVGGLGVLYLSKIWNAPRAGGWAMKNRTSNASDAPAPT